ncbi:uncharacterized protein EMH_0031460 [Eimeria mitis]|uniref:Methyltransferase type 11 domain-containing protein n=1 Tax=Eimeria mitis TaxID=44415 RepID=U6KDP6_9EIME|nr:uncharacterized protein EMH_0031460 [Eimeria mitis]CDJ36079.1 hypothetical protein, conserved [Eimeria mitis]
MADANVSASPVALDVQGALQQQQQQQDPQQEQEQEEQQKKQQEKRERRRQERQRRRRQQQKKTCRPESVSVPPELLGAALERQHVDSIYAKIALHFSHTRHRPWPRVAAFIESLPPDAILVDVGCGNGKYLHCRPKWTSSSSSDGDGGSSGSNSSSPYSCLSIGIDRSRELLHCASAHPQGALGPRILQADCLNTCIRDEVADGVICIAVLHHLTTEARRQQALGELARITRPGGRILIYVWALEHEAGSVGERKFPSQDVLVPWVYQTHYERARELSKSDGSAAGDAEPGSAAGETAAAAGPTASASSEREETFYRYYRVFSREELLGLCAKEKRLKVLDCYNDTNNWAVLLERVSC